MWGLRLALRDWQGAGVSVKFRWVWGHRAKQGVLGAGVGLWAVNTQGLGAAGGYRDPGDL